MAPEGLGPRIAVPRALAERKPAHGAPCNSCGLCCYASLCPLATFVFLGRPAVPGVHERGPCPALRFDGIESRCGLVVAPEQFAPVLTAVHGAETVGAAARLLIAAGDGCCSRINGEPKDEAFNARLEELDRVRAVEIAAARKLWRMP